MRTRPRLRLEPLEDREMLSVSGLFAIAGGPGTVPRVQVFDADTGLKITEFAPFEPNFTGGVTVAMADINGDGVGDLVVGAGPEGGPRVRIFDGQVLRALGPGFQPTLPGAILNDFFAFEASQRGGVTVSSGNFIGLGTSDDLVVGAGPGGGPRVRVFDARVLNVERLNFTGVGQQGVIADFFAFESTFRNGVNVAGSPNVTQVTFSDLVVAPGAGGSPRVRLLSGQAIATRGLQYDVTLRTDVLADFFAFDSSQRGGVFVSSADLNNDGFAEVIVGAGPGTPPIVTAFNGQTIFTQREQFTALSQGGVFDSFPTNSPAGNPFGVPVGASPSPFGPDLLLVGTGGPGVPGVATASRYTFGIAPTRTVVLNLPFAPNFFAPVNVSN